METPTAEETTSTQLFGVLYITLTGMVDSMIPTYGPWSLLGQSMSYVIKLAPILWWALPTSLAQPRPKLSNASTYAWFLDRRTQERVSSKVSLKRARMTRRVKGLGGETRVTIREKHD
ncbi:hypothetical protein DSO57_1023005 [Entomophthora muscae]|uniref:Uncharacterized protein n=1 Tax=Entomophthora muscae TaxID=34485 RepID=A0ACC2SRV6_9FUNG|nr:hypothetical protein DSO57_1023005 [Entomophthora muscae]